jgi:hypothetical protein
MAGCLLDNSNSSLASENITGQVDTMAAQQKDNEMLELGRGLSGTPWCEEYEKMISGMLYVVSPTAIRFSPTTY